MKLREDLVIFFALIISVGLHIMVLPIFYSEKPSMAHIPIAKATHLKIPDIENPEIELGIDKSRESTLTWIGYAEYEEQLARFAGVEQADMRASVNIAEPNPARVALTSMQAISKPIVQFASQFFELLQGIEVTVPTKKLDVVKEEEISVVTSLQSEVIEDIPVEGNPSDRDSEATSIVEISSDQWKAGKPLAAHGIVLRPIRPSFTPNQLVTNAPSDLVAELHIGNRGKPQRVVIVYSTGSGSIDRTLEASLYRWRASGDKIDALQGDDMIVITIHITFAK